MAINLVHYWTKLQVHMATTQVNDDALILHFRGAKMSSDCKPDRMLFSAILKKNGKKQSGHQLEIMLCHIVQPQDKCYLRLAPLLPSSDKILMS